jgi:cell division protein FtsQ
MTRERIDLTGQDESTVSSATRKDSPSRAINLVKDFEKGPESIEADILQDDALQNEDARFLRAEKRVPVRRGPLARKTAGRLKNALTLALGVAVASGLVAAAYEHGAQSGLFIIASSDNIEITGLRNTSRAEVMDVARDDLAKSVFSVPLGHRRLEFERLPWVESATVMRLFPNRIAIHLVERTPVAFVQVGARVHLIDASGVVLGPPANRQAKFSFPVIHGIIDTESLSARAAVMKIYNRLVRDLDSGNYTQQLSEVDLSDAEDVKATVNDSGGTVLIHLGSSNFLERYKLFVDHIGEWRQQFTKVQSVDMRYEGQIVVNPDMERSGDREEKPGEPRQVGTGRVIGRSGDHPTTPKAGVLGTPGDRKLAPAPSRVQRKARKKTARQESKAKSQKPRAKSQ